MEYTRIEFVAVNVLNIVPYSIIFLYALKNSIRFSRRATLIITAVICVAYGAVNGIIADLPQRDFYGVIVSAVLIGLSVVLIKTNLGYLIFIVIALKNCQTVVRVLAGYLEYLLWPENTHILYCWSCAVTTIMCECLLLPPIVMTIKKYFRTEESRKENSVYWKFIWTVPFFFYCTWIFMYFISDTDLVRVPQPVNSVFMLFSYTIQLIIYAAIAVAIEKSHQEVKLHDEIYVKEIQLFQYNNISRKIDYVNRLHHDLRHHLVVLSSMAAEGEQDKLKEYLKEQLEIVDMQSKLRYCKNEILNILLVYYYDKCHSAGIDYRVDLAIPENIQLSESETTVVFGNLIENAYEACQRQTEGERSIQIRGRRIGYSVVFSIENTVPAGYSFIDADIIESSKRKGSGIGIMSCKAVIEDKNGAVKFVLDKNFMAEFSIPITEPAQSPL